MTTNNSINQMQHVAVMPLSCRDFELYARSELGGCCESPIGDQSTVFHSQLFKNRRFRVLFGRDSHWQDGRISGWTEPRQRTPPPYVPWDVSVALEPRDRLEKGMMVKITGLKNAVQHNEYIGLITQDLNESSQRFVVKYLSASQKAVVISALAANLTPTIDIKLKVQRVSVDGGGTVLSEYLGLNLYLSFEWVDPLMDNRVWYHIPDPDDAWWRLAPLDMDQIQQSRQAIYDRLECARLSGGSAMVEVLESKIDPIVELLNGTSTKKLFEARAQLLTLPLFFFSRASPLLVEAITDAASLQVFPAVLDELGSEKHGSWTELCEDLESRIETGEAMPPRKSWVDRCKGIKMVLTEHVVKRYLELNEPRSVSHILTTCISGKHYISLARSCLILGHLELAQEACTRAAKEGIGVKPDLDHIVSEIKEWTGTSGRCTPTQSTFYPKEQPSQIWSYPCVHCGTKCSYMCSGCERAAFCSLACHRAEWPKHKVICNKEGT